MTVDTPADAAAALAGDDATPVNYAPDPADRIEAGPGPSDRTFEIALAIVAVMYLIMLSASMHFAVSPDNDRRGQIEGPPSIAVDLVQLPDANATAKLSQNGATAPPQPATPAMPPAPPVVEQPAEQQAQQQPKSEPPKPPDDPKKPERQQAKSEPSEAPAVEPVPKPADVAKDVLDLDSVDLSLDDEAREFERQIAELNRQRAAERSARRQTLANLNQTRILGKGATGQTSEYSKSVIAALFKTKPLAYTKRGEAVVGFEITRSGSLRYARLLKSSGDRDMDSIALNAIRRAKFEPPPPGTSDRDRIYVITYVFD